MAPIDVLPSPPALVHMTVDDYGPVLFQDIKDLARQVCQHAFKSTQQLRSRDILHVEELDDFFTERSDLENETRLFDESDSEPTVIDEKSCTSIKSRDSKDNLGSSVLLYAGLRQCGGLTQRNRGRVAHDYWSKKDEELMQSDLEAVRISFLTERAAAKGQPVTVKRPEAMEELPEETNPT
jgi:hypothetical protein